MVNIIGLPDARWVDDAAAASSERGKAARCSKYDWAGERSSSGHRITTTRQ
jgi:hypothetical protein